MSAVEDARPGVPDRGTQNGEPIASPKPKRAKRVKTAPATQRVLMSPGLPGGAWFEHEGVYVDVPTDSETKTPKPTPVMRVKAATPPIDPRLTAMSRELRDQWTERAGAIVPSALGKHDVKRIAQATVVPTAMGALRLGEAA